MDFYWIKIAVMKQDEKMVAMVNTLKIANALFLTVFLNFL